MMKRIAVVLPLAFILAATPLWAEKKESSIKSGIKHAVSETVSAGKDVVSGFAEGVEDGRKSGESVDKARIVSNKEELQQFLRVEVLDVKELAPGEFKVSVAFHNQSEAIVRLTKLGNLGNVVLLDKDNFAYPLPEATAQSKTAKDVNVLPKASTKASFVFTNVEGQPAVFRLFNQDNLIK